MSKDKPTTKYKNKPWQKISILPKSFTDKPKLITRDTIKEKTDEFLKRGGTIRREEYVHNPIDVEGDEINEKSKREDWSKDNLPIRRSVEWDSY